MFRWVSCPSFLRNIFANINPVFFSSTKMTLYAPYQQGMRVGQGYLLLLRLLERSLFATTDRVYKFNSYTGRLCIETADKIAKDLGFRVVNYMGAFGAHEIVNPKTKQIVTWNSGSVEKLR
jgi:hypothetical protein